MRVTKLAALLAIVILGFSVLAMAGRNKFGVADSQRVTFTEPIKVGDVLLPKGEYKVEHTMEGENHVMVFTQLSVAEPAIAHAKCQLVPLPKKAEHTQLIYTHTSTDVHVLQEMIFSGDSAKHVF